MRLASMTSQSALRDPSALNWPAIMSLATALASAVALFIFALPGAVFAIVLGHVGISHSERLGVGRGQAVAGLVIGYVLVAFWLVSLIALVANLGYSFAQLRDYFGYGY